MTEPRTDRLETPGHPTRDVPGSSASQHPDPDRSQVVGIDWAAGPDRVVVVRVPGSIHADDLPIQILYGDHGR